MGGTPSHDRPQGFFSCTLKCHHSNGELYSVRFARDSVTLSSMGETILTEDNLG